MLKKHIVVSFFFLTFFLLNSVSVIFAHPGNTAADGCHYCRTNCAKWGVPENERHCHGGSSSSEKAPEITAAPKPKYTSTPKPTYTPKPTIIPTYTKIPTPTQKLTKAIINCSATKDSKCPSKCSAGNDADCCEQNLVNYTWYENYGCYPKQEVQCSGIADNICPSNCDNGWDADCCEQNLTGYKWYENWGCYEE